MNKLLIYWTLLGSLFSVSAWCQVEKPLPLLFNFGGHTEFYKSVQTDASGSTRSFEFAPTLGLGAQIDLAPSWHFLPEFNWVLPQEAGTSRIIKNTFMLRADFGYDLLEWFRLRAGTSLLWHNQHGRGGKTVMNNGNDTSTFYYPEENRSSLNNTLDLGAELLLEQWAFRLQTYIYSVFKADKRQTSYTLFVSYYWDRL